MIPTPPFNAWVTCPRPQPQARLRLFCFPYAGGGAAIFRDWWRYLPAEIEVCPLQPPGREQRLAEPPFTQLTPLVQTLTDILQPYLDLPFAFFGHSLGGLLSFECARQLRRQYGPSPLHLSVSACRAPHMARRESPIHRLPDQAFVAQLRRLNGTPEAVLRNADLMALFFPVLRADFAVYETYVYTAEAPLACPISAFGGRNDREVSKDALTAWDQQTGHTFTLLMFPGDHFFLHTAQALLLQTIAQQLRQY